MLKTMAEFIEQEEEGSSSSSTSSQVCEMNGSLFSLLPPDVIYEILTWVPLQCLQSCRQVCVAWHNLTYEPGFLALHCQRTRTLSGYFLQSMKFSVYSTTFVSIFNAKCSSSAAVLPPPSPSFEFLPKNTQIWSATHHGLVCCQLPPKNYGSPPRFCVCKPATQQWREIPNPRTRFHTCQIDIVATPTRTLHFKIVRLSIPRYSYKSRSTAGTICEIFDSTTWRWKRYQELLPPLVLGREAGVQVDDVVHWLVKLVASYQHIVLAFDVNRKKWWLMPLPPRPEEAPAARVNQREVITISEKLIGACGQLWLIRHGTLRRNVLLYDEEVDEVWVMVDDSDRGRSWEKVQLERLMKLKGERDTIQHLFTREVVLLTSAVGITWIDLRKGEVTEVPVNYGAYLKIFKFESDLEPCNLLDARRD